MKVIILAAGMGTRLGKYTKNIPKCMLKFKGKPLIQWQVETLRDCGLKDITIVKGYMPEKIKLGGVKTYLNPDFANTNMVETLFCAEKEMTDDLLVIYSDILYEKKLILNALINAGYRVDPIFTTHGWMEFDTVEDYEKANQWDKEDSLKRFINLPR